MNGFILHLQGPMMSFADTGFGQLREAGPFPSRSVVLGIIAAALGLERGDTRLLDLHQRMRVHVGTARAGTLLVDYHTVLPTGYGAYDPTRLRRPGAEGNPVLTDRGYHVDSHFVALISSDDGPMIDDCRAALHNPIFTGYLGRRSCVPSTPLIPEDASGPTVIDALSHPLWSAHQGRIEKLPPWERRRQKRAHVDAFIDGDAVDQPEQCSATIIAKTFRRDLLNAVPRSYVTRPVTHVRIAVPTEVDATNTTEEYFDAAP